MRSTNRWQAGSHLRFYSIHHDPHRIRDLLSHQFPEGTILGCCGESIVGGSREIEHDSALSLWMARLPGVSLSPFHLTYASDVDQGSFWDGPRISCRSGRQNLYSFCLANPFHFQPIGWQYCSTRNSPAYRSWAEWPVGVIGQGRIE